MKTTETLCQKYAYNIYIRKRGYTLIDAFRNYPKYYNQIANYLYILRAKDIIDQSIRIADLFGDMQHIMNSFAASLRELQISIEKISDGKGVKEHDVYTIKSSFNTDDLDVCNDRWNLAVNAMDSINAYIQKAKYYSLPINEDLVNTLRLKCMIVATDAKLTIDLINKYKQGDLRINGKR